MEVTREIAPSLKQYLESEILPQYLSYDKGHNIDHITQVANESLELASTRCVNYDMVYTAAIFHDLGLIEGREIHHLASARMLRKDNFIIEFFSTEELNTIADAIEDHRASAKTPPRTIYGEILSSADRVIDADTIIMRSYYHSEKHYPTYTMEGHLERIHSHVVDKYAEKGYLRVPILTARNKKGLEYLRSLLQPKAKFMEYALRVIKKNLEEF